MEPRRLELVSGHDNQSTHSPARRADPPASDDVACSLFAAPSPGLVFETDALRQCLEELWRVVGQDDRVAIVTGEKGAGKTLFLHWFLSRAGDDWDICHIAARMALGEKHILEALGRALFSEPTTDDARIKERLIERGRQGPFTLIIVDDADNLSAFAIKTLFDFKRAVTESGGRIGVVLAARPFALDSRFTAPSLRDYRKEWASAIELPHLTEAQTADYIRHRVDVTGLSDRVSFDENQLKNIYKGSQGVPLYINRLAQAVLTGARPRRYRTERQRRERSRRRKTLIAATGLSLLAVTVGYVVYAVAFKPSIFDIALEEAILEGRFDDAASSAPTRQQGVLPEMPSPNVPPDIPLSRQNALPEDATPAGEQPSVAISATVTSSGAAAGTEADKSNVASDAGLVGNAWLMAQDPEAYTIQLAGTPEEAKAHQFIDKYPLSGDVIAVRTLRRGRIWHMVLYNSYPTMAAARRDIDALPAAVRRNQPFARRFDSVQSIAAE